MLPDRPPSVSSSYPWAQLQAAVTRARLAGDRAEQARAQERIIAWQRILDGMESGELLIGSRTPVADTPAWVTLEVAHGGFATGRYLAEQPLDSDEQDLLRALGAQVPAGSTPREQLNLWFLTDAGQARLRAALDSGGYQVRVPEESALVAVTYLIDRERYAAALDLVVTLRPLMHRLRMTPSLRAPARPPGSTVRLRTVSHVAGPLRDATENPRMAAMVATLRIWNPLYDRLVSLWCATVDGELPTLDPVTQAVRGGWPCAVVPEAWASERQEWLSDFHEAQRTTSFTGRNAHRKSNFSRLLAALEDAADGPATLTPAQVGWVRRAIANTVSRHGAPGSQSRAALRSVQAQVARHSTYAQLAHVLAARLDAFPGDGGLPFIDPLAVDVSDQEAALASPGTPMPAHLVRKLHRALDAPVSQLIELGVISSGDSLATVLPQITAQAVAANIADPVLGTLFTRTYQAFRQRRSLLLLNLEQQVRLEELPWIASLAEFRTSSPDAARAAASTLSEATLLTLTAFPQAILPNPLVREFGALVTAAGLQLPLVEEVAADIFMGTFTTKWRRSAALASTALENSLYARYYALPGPGTWLTEAPAPRWRLVRRSAEHTADDFAALCASRAQEAHTGGPGSRVAANGAILEQSQILTTHNVIQLIDALALRPQISRLAMELASECLDSISRGHLQPQATLHAHLINVKRHAYALRQAILFLSLAGDAEARAVAAHWNDSVAADARLAELLPVSAGLLMVAGGGRFDHAGRSADTRGRRLLGWSVGRHWLSPFGALPA